MSADGTNFWSGRSVALTGATGFIGSHVAVALRVRRAEVVALHRAESNVSKLLAIGVKPVVAPLSDSTALAEGCRGAEVLIHAAGTVDFSANWDAVRAVNVGGTQTVLAAARQAGVRRVVHISSVVAVGATREPILQDETACWNLKQYRVPYATTKREAEAVALAAAFRGLDVVVVNPSCVIGPDDFGGSEFGILCKRFWRGRMPVHFLGGNNFVDVRDVASGILAAAMSGRSGERYLLAGENLRWPAFFRELARVTGRAIPRFSLPGFLASPLARIVGLTDNKPGHRPAITPEQARLVGLYFFFSSAKAECELGFRPRSVRESLADAHAFWQGKGAA